MVDEAGAEAQARGMLLRVMHRVFGIRPVVVEPLLRDASLVQLRTWIARLADAVPVGEFVGAGMGVGGILDAACPNCASSFPSTRRCCMGTPHDVLFRAAFAEPRVALEWIRSVVPAAVAEILDWSTLAVARAETLGPKLSLHVADLAFEVVGVDGVLRVAIVVEHKSAEAEGTNDQMLRYTVLRKHWFRMRKKLAPPVVPILLQHGASGVTEGQAACMPAELAALQPQLRLLVDDLRTVSEEQIRARSLHPLATLVLLALRTLPQVASVDEALAALARWQDLIDAESRDVGPPNPAAMLEAVGWYVLEVTDVTEEQLPMELKPPQDDQGVVRMTTGQRIRMEARAAGRSEGRTEGLSEGRTEEARRMLVRLLNRRFGVSATEVDARLQGATLEQLEAWVDRILDVESVDALFAGK